MPGINFVQLYNGKITDWEKTFRHASGPLYLLPENTIKTLFKTDSMELNCKIYPAYPVSLWETEDFCLLLEGHIYNKHREQIQSYIGPVLQKIFAEEINGPWLRQWLLDTDGEFIIWLYEKRTRKTAVLNDIFGRLPLYYLVHKDRVIVTRDIRFILTQDDRPSIDKLSLAHYLLLGHGLDEKTIWSNVCCLTPASFLLINPSERKASARCLHTFNFSTLKHRYQDTDENAKVLAGYFTRACVTRSGRAGHDVVSLSGGLDSRSIAAALAESQTPFSSITFHCGGYNSQEEIEIARKTAAVLKVPWEVKNISPLKCHDASALLHLKCGASPLYMAFILQFFRDILAKYGQGVVYFTGDGGDQCLPTLRPPLRVFHSSGDLADYIIEDNYFRGRQSGIQLAAKLTGISGEDLKQSLVENILRYPEDTLEGKWLHYQFYGITAKIYFEAEDRNRCYFWSTGPFYSNDFFLHAINCTQQQKSAFKLYRKFLNNLSPRVSEIDYSGYHGPVGSINFILSHYKKRLKFIRPELSFRLKHFTKGINALLPHAKILSIMRRQLTSCPAIADYVNPEVVNNILSSFEKYDKQHMLSLFNTMSTLEHGLCGKSTLDEYPDEALT